MTLRPRDRVLMLAIPSHAEVAGIAARLEDGLLVALGSGGEVDAARAALSHLQNVMFLDARPDSIPWREAYFTRIIVPSHLEPLLRSAGDSLHRLLAPEGEIVLDRKDC